MTLSEDQLTFYRQNGYLLASGLIPAPIAAQAEAAMCPPGRRGQRVPMGITRKRAR